jgi:AcrR family transcriptional regulator
MIRRIAYSHSRLPHMKTPGKPVISARKSPRQWRSTRLVEDILEAAIRVLSREGAQRFTTARVAEAAGVSVGSLYQYFPNKEAILFRLQTDEWKRTGELLHSILADPSRAPLDRLRATVQAGESDWHECAELRAGPVLRSAGGGRATVSRMVFQPDAGATWPVKISPMSRDRDREL